MTVPHSLSRLELARFFALEFFPASPAAEAARAVAEVLPEQSADFLASAKKVEERVRGFRAFVITMIVGTVGAIFFRDFDLAGLALLSGAAGSFARARAVYLHRRLSFIAESSTDARTLEEERARFVSLVLPVLRVSRPALFPFEETSAA